MKLFFTQNKKVIMNIVILGLAYVTGLAIAMVHGYGITWIETLVPCLMALAAVVYFKAAVLWQTVSKRKFLEVRSTIMPERLQISGLWMLECIRFWDCFSAHACFCCLVSGISGVILAEASIRMRKALKSQQHLLRRTISYFHG